MWTEFFAATVGVLLTVVFHAAGLAWLSWTLDRVHPQAEKSPLKRTVAAGLLTVGLVAISTVEIWAYALFYVQIDAIPDLRASLYFSTLSFSTLGFNEGAISEQWKLVGAIEGINGALLIGWSVAFLVVEISRHAPLPRRSRGTDQGQQ